MIYWQYQDSRIQVINRVNLKWYTWQSSMTTLLYYSTKITSNLEMKKPFEAAHQVDEFGCLALFQLPFIPLFLHLLF